ncbi:hypothetical protein MVEN_02153700 [Mycena venus]|uniref:Uncharacterized protein n=1 Tax=Mycena venus TaxID=2733690 RepID=A0A8H6X9Y2_9AGAR|nr:hypothetical protein MVEN_02153700 [Mycena venus]
MSADPADTAMSSSPPSPLTPLTPQSVVRDLLPHLPSHPKPAAPSSSAMSKLDFPKLNEELTSMAIHSWLGRCEDTYETWQALNPDKTMAPCMLITLVGLKMEESTVATWWNENREKLKKLEAWVEFAQEVKDRFVPSNWRMVALATFYSVQQGQLTFPAFVKALQNTCNALVGAGQGWVISDAILKNHLLFHSHPILRLRVMGQQTLLFTTMKVDTLIATMSSTWDSLLAEGIIKAPRAAPAPTPLLIPSLPMALSTSLPTPTSAVPLSSSSGLATLTHAKKEALHAANGCYHCRKTLQTPGWIKHHSNNCTGDPALGIPPRSVTAVVASVVPTGFTSAYDSDGGYGLVAVVMPAYNPDKDDFSFGTDDSDLSRHN